MRSQQRLQMEVPAQHHQPSPRADNPAPRPWEYPVGVPVLRLDRQGAPPYGGTRYLMCEALAAEDVGVQEFDGRLLGRPAEGGVSTMSC